MNRRFLPTVALAALFLGGCAAHTSLVPLGRGNVAGYAGLGGPIVEAFDTHIPIPYVLGGADYGLRDDLNLYGALHLLPLMYHIAGLDVGTAWFPVTGKGLRPTVGVGPRLFIFASTKSGVDERFLVFPVVSGSAAWRVKGGLLYTGADLAVPLKRPAYDDDAAPVIFSPFVGYRWTLGMRYTLFTELKLHGANLVADQLVTGYTTFGRRGAVTPLIAIQRRF